MKNYNLDKKALETLINDMQSMAQKNFDLIFIADDAKFDRFGVFTDPVAKAYAAAGSNPSESLEELHHALQQAGSFMHQAHDDFREWDAFVPNATQAGRDEDSRLRTNTLDSAARAKSELLECLTLARKMKQEVENIPSR